MLDNYTVTTPAPGLRCSVWGSAGRELGQTCSMGAAIVTGVAALVGALGATYLADRSATQRERTRATREYKEKHLNEVMQSMSDFLAEWSVYAWATHHGENQEIKHLTATSLRLSLMVPELRDMLDSAPLLDYENNFKSYERLHHEITERTYKIVDELRSDLDRL